MILTIRKPIARFMRFALGRQYVFVLTKGGKTKLRRVFTSDWDDAEYIRRDDATEGRLPLCNYHVCATCRTYYYLSVAHRRRIYPSATSDHPSHVIYMTND